MFGWLYHIGRLDDYGDCGVECQLIEVCGRHKGALWRAFSIW